MTNRSRKLLDYWLPPEGVGRCIGCVATSFTFDPDFFESECLSRFLGLDAIRGENKEMDLSVLIQQEERLAETRVSVVVDRSEVGQARSLRWDVLPVGLRTGVQHAKVAVLVWERLVRVIVTSANLTESGYRKNVEVGMAFDGFLGSRVPGPVFLDLVSAAEAIVHHSPGADGRPGPKARALDTLEHAVALIKGFDLPQRSSDGIRIDVIAGDALHPVLPQLLEATKGGPPRRAVVMSPFFDVAEEPSLAAGALSEHLAQRGDTSVTFVVPVDTMESRTIIRAPKALRAALHARHNVEFRPFKQANEDEVRRLHGKSILLGNRDWTTVMIGSSNFTAAGLSLSPYRSNLEVNVAVTVAATSPEAEALETVLSGGDQLDLSDAEWDPEADSEETASSTLPWGFVDCLLFVETEGASLKLTLDPASLPPEWVVLDGRRGVELSNSNVWLAEGRPTLLSAAVDRDALPFFLDVRWSDGTQECVSGWAVNVSEPGTLPPPEELRDLPMDALLRALASTRPIHEALARILVERDSSADGSASELDPLKRYSGTGRLLARARQASAALAGLRQRLERPLSSLDALEWRLFGPLGPVALAGSLGAHSDPDLIPGEPDFLLAELALTLSRVDWSKPAGRVPEQTIRNRVSDVLHELGALRSAATEADQRLTAYVDRAFAEASQ